MEEGAEEEELDVEAEDDQQPVIEEDEEEVEAEDVDNDYVAEAAVPAPKAPVISRTPVSGAPKGNICYL